MSKSSDIMIEAVKKAIDECVKTGLVPNDLTEEKKQPDSYSVITVECSNSAVEAIKSLLYALQYCGSVGTSRNIRFVYNDKPDKDMEDQLDKADIPYRFGFDGDGSDKIYDIRVEEIDNE